MKASVLLLLFVAISGCMPPIETNLLKPEGSTSSKLPVSIERKFAIYESNKLDKATALAYSLFCPGAGLTYTGDGSGAFVSLGANALATYGFFNAIDKRDSDGKTLYGLMMIVGRIADINYSLSGVDDYNSRLRVKVGLASLGPDGKPQPTFTLSLRF